MEDFISIENELKKRWPYHYHWGQKQNDLWDRYTKFIYETETWEALMPKMQKVISDQHLDKRSLFNYASNRWYNFWSSVAVENIFSDCEGVKPVFDKKDSEKDFYLCGIPFDHKTTIFPAGFGKSFAYAKDNETELIKWLYKNQSPEKRHHLKNRLFIVVYAEAGEHWKLKAEIGFLKGEIEKYISTFKTEQLHSVNFTNHPASLSDIIWLSK